MRRLELVCDIVMVGNNIQLLTGIALMLTIFTRASSLGLYHLRLMFETTSFVGVGSAAALCVWSLLLAARHGRPKPSKKEKMRIFRKRLTAAGGIIALLGLKGTRGAVVTSRFPRRQRTKTPSEEEMKREEEEDEERRLSHLSPSHRLMLLYAFMFLALAIFLGMRFGGWDDGSQTLAVEGSAISHRAEGPETTRGKCYLTGLTAAPSSSHPGPDRIYIGITTTWLLFSLLAALGTRPDTLLPGGGVKRGKKVLAGTLVQFPLHLYMMIALRTANQGLFEGKGEHGRGENGWDFGQTIAIVLLLVTINEAWQKFWEYHGWERSLRAACDADRQSSAPVGTESADETRGETGKRDIELGVVEAGSVDRDGTSH
jgi:hypothetical protein